MAEELGMTEEGRARALAVGSWLFGVEEDAEGHFPELEGMWESGAGWVIAGNG